MSNDETGATGAGASAPSGHAPPRSSAAPDSTRTKTMGMMARSVAHEVNNLMGVILGNTALARSFLGTGHAGVKALDEIEGAAEKAGQLAQQLLAFTEGTHKRRRLVNLNGIAGQVLLLEEHELAPRIRVVRYMDPDLWDIEVDPGQLSHIVMTLGLNAVEAIEDEGRVVIVTRNMDVDDDFARTNPGLHPGKYACLTIEDTGHGIGADALGRIFDPSLPSATPSGRQNLPGLYRAVKELQGHIAAYSEGGQGATFMLYLPAADSDTAAGSAHSAILPQGTETILVIDDEPMIVNVTKKLLEQLGYRTLVANNGQEAIEIAQSYEGPIDMALLDMAMPVMGGAETYPQLKRARPNLRVIICSGLELDAISRALFDAGVSGFLHKPYQATTLSQTIRQVLDQ